MKIRQIRFNLNKGDLEFIFLNTTVCKATQGQMARKVSGLAKLTATQKVIKNKFIEAYKSRVEHENDVNKSMKPHSHISRTISKQTSKNSINQLCNRLQTLINSHTSTNADNNKHEMKMIISKLSELGVIV